MAERSLRSLSWNVRRLGPIWWLRCAAVNAWTATFGDRKLRRFIAEQEAKQGTGADAIAFALDELDDHYDRLNFLEDWRSGRIASEDDWEDYRDWLRGRAA